MSAREVRARRAVEALITDLKRGLKNEWHAVDAEVREELRATWTAILVRELLSDAAMATDAEVKLAGLLAAWEESWDCSGHPGHPEMVEAVEKARGVVGMLEALRVARGARARRELGEFRVPPGPAPEVRELEVLGLGQRALVLLKVPSGNVTVDGDPKLAALVARQIADDVERKLPGVAVAVVLPGWTAEVVR